MSKSVKSIMSCIGVNTSGTVSVLGNLFGLLRKRVPSDPCISTTAEVSVLNQVNRLKGKHVHLNIIRVGIDNFSSAEVDKIDYAIYRAHKIFNTRLLGIGRVEHYDVTNAEAGGKADIGSDDEAEDLTQDWTVDNNAIDVFMVDNISTDFVGLSPVGGPCDKDAKGMNGVLGGEVNRTSSEVARTFVHEIGHYLGLGHKNSSTNNLMCQTKFATSTCNSVLLTSSQGDTIRGHCFVKNGC
jgi:hypothetical protein